MEGDGARETSSEHQDIWKVMECAGDCRLIETRGFLVCFLSTSADVFGEAD